MKIFCAKLWYNLQNAVVVNLQNFGRLGIIQNGVICKI